MVFQKGIRKRNMIKWVWKRVQIKTINESLEIVNLEYLGVVLQRNVNTIKCIKERMKKVSIVLNQVCFSFKMRMFLFDTNNTSY